MAADRKRHLLGKIIEDHGGSEILGPCFDTAEAFRRTAVDVALVSLAKPGQAGRTVNFVEAELEPEPEVNTDDADLANQLERPNVVKSLVLRHAKAVEAAVAMFRACKEMEFYSPGRIYRRQIFDEIAIEGDNDRAATCLTKHITALSWDKVFEMTKFGDLASAKVRQDFDAFQKDQQGIAFTEDNISKVLDSLFASRRDIQRQCILDAFDYMTAYHKENRIHVEGWKSNEAWKVSRKVVLPGIVNYDPRYGLKPSVNHSYSWADRITDIDRAMCALDGRKLENVVTIVHAIEAHVRASTNADWHVRPFESEFFTLRIYKKCTGHFVFKNESLWERFNIEAARGKNWLPDDYQHREKAADKYAVVPAVNA